MLSACLVMAAAIAADPGPAIAFAEQPGQIVITAGGRPVATYVYQDKEISRPYLAHVHAPAGVQVTRNHPPIEGKDLVDHATFHPGIWLAFGDIDGEDYWRLESVVRHESFVEPPAAKGASGSFVVQNAYLRRDAPQQFVCQERCRYTIVDLAGSYLLVIDSVFYGPRPFAFGDQEEMGLGVRVATPISVKSGGQIRDAAGRINGDEVWGKSSAWCDYSGTIDGHQVGMLVMPDPANFRPSRYHARDYGMLAANPFGQKVFGEAEASRVPVAAGASLRLRFGVQLHAAKDNSFDQQNAYEEFLARLPKLPRPNP